MIVKVKICGIRSLKAAQVAIKEGADFLGFNFVPRSKRYINPNDAKEIIDEIRIKNQESRIRIVGVFQNEQIDEVNRIGEMLDLDFVQLHGEEDEEYIRRIKYSIIKKVNIHNANNKQLFKGNQESGIRNHEEKSLIHNSCFMLLDREVQGYGDMIDLDQAKKIAAEYKIFFSGGLTSNNVANIVTKVRPYAVDVASGIETDGQQDLEKIKSFIKTAKEVNI